MVINQYIAVLDACVLAPMPLADTLLRLAEEPAFYVPRWSGDILNEVANTLAKFGCSSEQIKRRIAAMEGAFEDALVTGYEDLVPALKTDPKDRHVLAASVRTGAHAIVTNNKNTSRKKSWSHTAWSAVAATNSWFTSIISPPTCLLRRFGSRLRRSDEAFGNTLRF
jgi:hypothetical protein